MKKTFFLIGVMVALTVSAGRAQSTRYTKTLDNPDETISSMLNITPIGGSFASGKYSPTALTFGANGMYGITSRLGFEASAALPFFSTKTEGGPSFIEGGAFLNLLSHEKTMPVRVLLSYRHSTDVYTSSETYKYIEVPAKVKTLTGVRGGLQYNTSIVKTDGIKIPEAVSDLNLGGVYAGIQFTRKHFVKVQLNGDKEPRPSGSIFRVFADALVYPVCDIKDPFLASQIKTGNLGGRAGVNWVPNPYGKKHQASKYNPFFGRMNMSLEIGSRPVEGLYFKGGLSFGILYH